MITEKITQLKVMQSAAGYYVGREYYDEEIGCWLPYSRNSEYFATEEEAGDCLRYLG